MISKVKKKDDAQNPPDNTVRIEIRIKTWTDVSAKIFRGMQNGKLG
jgi:hypothetical protein